MNDYSGLDEMYVYLYPFHMLDRGDPSEIGHLEDLGPTCVLLVARESGNSDVITCGAKAKLLHFSLRSDTEYLIRLCS